MSYWESSFIAGSRNLPKRSGSSNCVRSKRNAQINILNGFFALRYSIRSCLGLTGSMDSMLRVTNTTRGTTVGDKVELADTSLKRMFGLLGRRGLDAGGGLWIRPSSGVHTFGMTFSIDVVGLDRELKVIKLWSCLVPFRLTSVSFKMRSVLEFPCGVISRSQMQLGDQLHISDSSEPASALASDLL